MSLDYPRITVVTPAYKAARLIEATMKSVLDQNYPNLEYIVLDGAGDHTGEILARYDSQLAHWRSAPDHGQYAAINEGFARTTGDILCWLNADDMFHPRSLFVVASVFARFAEVDWLSSLTPTLWDASGQLAAFTSTPGFSREALLDGLYLPGTMAKGYWIQQESTFFRRSLWEKAGGKIPDYSLAGDFALWCEFARHADLVGQDYPLAGFRLVEGQRSQAVADYMGQGRAALDALRSDQHWLPGRNQRLRQSMLAKIPKLRGLLREQAGYRASKIINPDLRQPVIDWQMVDYRFLA